MRRVLNAAVGMMNELAAVQVIPGLPHCLPGSLPAVLAVLGELRIVR